jgi:hypothetical protein
VQGLRLIETHVSWILLTGTWAYKLKRPVAYGFIDLRDARARELCCREEVRLNRRFSSGLYEGVVPVVDSPTGLRVSGEGEALEYAVRMRQFDPEQGLDKLLLREQAGTEELEAFGRSLSGIHAGLPVVGELLSWGTPQSVGEQVNRNIDEVFALLTGEDERARLGELGPRLRDRFTRSAASLRARRDAGRVRECHGDLHARNVVRWQGALTAFDCLEFEPAFRWIDVAEEIAFLRVDLQARGHAHHAHAFLQGWLEDSGDADACRVLDLYGAHRALVRVKVSLLTPSERPLAPRYLQAAESALAPRPVRLVLMCGLSGSGKTRIAHELAPLLDAVHLRSDVERKRMAGLGAGATSGSGVGTDLYSARRTGAVYDVLRDLAGQVLDGGMSVIIDASFMRREHRDAFAQLARSRGCKADIVHCTAPAQVLRRRVAERHAAGEDASEADLRVLEWQQAHFEAPTAGEGGWMDAVTTESSGILARRIAQQLRA